VRICFIVNPAAGRSKAMATWKRVEPFARSLGPLEVRFTEYPRHGTELARQAVADGFDRVAVVGGDGSINEVGNGLVNSSAALAVIPGGTGNDFARTVGIPHDAEAAVRLAFSGRTRPVDVGHFVGHHYFFNIAGSGFDAAVANTVHRAWYKKLGGTLPYIIAVLQTLVTYRPQPMTVEIDGQSYARKALLVSIGNTQYTGGGMMMLPDAVCDDGLLDVVIGGNVTKLETLGLLPKIFTGRHKGHPKIEFFRGKHITISSEAELLVNVDGDISGALPATFEVLAGALLVVTP
jgi:diacylglycerol kinase (ATP)